MNTIKEIFEAMPASFQKDAAVGLNVLILFDITGDGGGQWQVAINDGELSINEGGHESPTLTLTVTAQDYLDISNGELNAQLAFMTGRLRAAGDLRLAMKMPLLFKE